MAYLVFLVITFLGLLALFHDGLLGVLVIVFLYRDGLQGYLASFGILYLQHEAFAILDYVHIWWGGVTDKYELWGVRLRMALHGTA